MKTLKKLFYLLTLVGLVGLVSCEDDPTYTPAQPQTDSMQVYFDANSASTISVKLNSGDITIPLMRNNVEEPYTSSLEVTMDEETKKVLSLNDNTVTFNPGDSVFNVVLAVNYEAMKYDTEYEVSLALTDAQHVFDYGIGTYTFKVVCPAPWKYLGIGVWSDDLLSGLYGPSLAGAPWEVDIYESELKKGVYRIQDVYTAGTGIFAMVNFSDLTGAPKGSYIDIDCSDPENVVLGFQPTGMQLQGLGELWIGMLQGCEGKLDMERGGVISFTPGKLFIGTQDMRGAYGNANGLFEIYLPGASFEPPVLDPEVEVSFEGIFTDKKDNDNAVLKFDINESTTKYQWVVLSDVDPDSDMAKMIADLIAKGEYFEPDAIREGTKAGYESFKLSNEGKYTVLAVPFGAEGAVGYSAVAFDYQRNKPEAPKEVAASIEQMSGMWTVNAETLVLEGSFAPYNVEIKLWDSETQRDHNEMKFIGLMPAEFPMIMGQDTEARGFLSGTYSKGDKSELTGEPYGNITTMAMAAFFKSEQFDPNTWTYDMLLWDLPDLGGKFFIESNPCVISGGQFKPNASGSAFFKLYTDGKIRLDGADCLMFMICDPTTYEYPGYNLDFTNVVLSPVGGSRSVNGVNYVKYLDQMPTEYARTAKLENLTTIAL